MPTIAAIQMCSTDKVDENLAIAGKLIAEAAKNGATLVVLPEMFSVIGLNQNALSFDEKELNAEKIQKFLSKQAKESNLWIVGGTIPIPSQNKIRAACIIYSNTGEVVARYDKIHLFDVMISENEVYKESETTETGNKLVVVDTPVGKLGLAVCYDIRFPAIFAHLFNQGAEIIAIPASFTVKTGQAHWEVLAKSRAIENFCYVVGACQGGTHASGRKTYGHSLIIDPWGSIVSEKLELTPGIIYADINLKELYEIRSRMGIGRYKKMPLQFSF